MGMYSRGINDVLDVNLEAYDAIECNSEYFVEAAIKSVVEGEENYNNIMQAVGISEYCYFEENGVEMVYEAADIKGFIGKIKQFFINLWQKIKGLFNKFCALFDSYTKSDKDFVNKYRRHLLTVNMRDFEFKGFKFSDNKIDSVNIEKVYAAAAGVASSKLDASNLNDEKILELADGDKSEVVEKMRGKALDAVGGSYSQYDASEFSKELFMVFRDNEDSKVTLENISIADQLGYIVNSKDAIKTAEKAYKALDKTIKQILKDLDKAEKELVKTVPNKENKDESEIQTKKIRVSNSIIYFVKEALSISQTVNGALLTALKDRNRQAKSICVAAMNYKPKNESVDYAGYSESGSLLDGVRIR